MKGQGVVKVSELPTLSLCVSMRVMDSGDHLHKPDVFVCDPQGNVIGVVRDIVELDWKELGHGPQYLVEMTARGAVIASFGEK